MSDNPKKTFLSTLGKHLVVGSALMPAVEPKPPTDQAAEDAAKKAEEEKKAAEAKAAKEAEDAAAAKKADDDKKAAEAAKAAPPVVPPVAPKRPDPLPAIKAEDIEPAPAAPGDAPKPVSELLGYTPIKAEVKYLEVLRAGALREPEKYQPIFDREVDRLKKVNAFAAKWREEHPDEELSPEDPKYKRFLADNPPAIDREDHEDLKDELRVDKARELARADLREEMTANQRKILEMESKPEIEEAISEVEKAVLAALPDALPKDDYLHGVLKDGVGALEKVPGEGRIFATALARGRNVVSEFLRLRKGVAEFDPRNGAHVFISRAIATAGEVFESQGGAERFRGTKRFVQPKDFLKLTPDAKKRHWTFSDSELIATFADATAKGALQELEDRRKDDAANAEFKKAKVPGGTPTPKPPVVVPSSSPAVTPSPNTPAGGPQPVKFSRLKSMMGIPDKT